MATTKRPQITCPKCQQTVSGNKDYDSKNQHLSYRTVHHKAWQVICGVSLREWCNGGHVERKES